MIKTGKILLILFFSFFLPSSQPFSQQRETPPVTLEKISDSLYQILGGRGANGGVYIGDNGVLVIDSKMTEESPTSRSNSLSTPTATATISRETHFSQSP